MTILVVQLKINVLKFDFAPSRKKNASISTIKKRCGILRELIPWVSEVFFSLGVTELSGEAAKEPLLALTLLAARWRARRPLASRVESYPLGRLISSSQVVIRSPPVSEKPHHALENSPSCAAEFADVAGQRKRLSTHFYFPRKHPCGDAHGCIFRFADNFCMGFILLSIGTKSRHPENWIENFVSRVCSFDFR